MIWLSVSLDKLRFNNYTTVKCYHTNVGTDSGMLWPSHMNVVWRRTQVQCYTDVI